MPSEMNKSNHKRLTVISNHVVAGDGIQTPDESTVLHRRDGSILRAGHILKSDNFPGLAQLDSKFDGVQNLRKVEVDGGRIRFVGCAQPTRQGIANLLTHLGPKGAKLWINCRSEPVLYINGQPCSVKKRRDPATHLKWNVGDRRRTPELEDELQLEVQNEAREYNWKVMVHDEKNIEGEPVGEIVHDWVSLEKDHLGTLDTKKLQTLEQVYQEFSDKVSFVRWPVDDERAPQERRFDELAAQLTKFVSKHNEDEHGFTVIFNCHQGRGRTSTAMVLAHMLLGRQQILRSPDLSIDDVADAAIEGLVAKIPNGKEAQARADASIGVFRHMTDLKGCMKKEQAKLKQSPHSQKSRDKMMRYRHRYKYIILFGSYLSEGVQSEDASGDPFSFEYHAGRLYRRHGECLKPVLQLRWDQARDGGKVICEDGCHASLASEKDRRMLHTMAVRAGVEANGFPLERVRCPGRGQHELFAANPHFASNSSAAQSGNNEDILWACDECKRVSRKHILTNRWTCICNYNLCGNCFEKRKHELGYGITFTRWMMEQNSRCGVYNLLDFDDWASSASRG